MELRREFTMSKLNNNKGFTLTETVASMAMMSLITLTLLMVLSMSYINTFNLKEKGEILNELNEISESIYVANMDKNEVSIYLETIGGSEVENNTYLSTRQDNFNKFNFYISEPDEFVQGTKQLEQKIEIYYFYKNNSQGIEKGVEHQLVVPNPNLNDLEV